MYHKLYLGQLRKLATPIVSHRPRRLVFVPTTWQKFERARQINDLFADSPLEDTLWDAFKRERIDAERQWEVGAGMVRYRLDFAIFCPAGPVDIECDGDTWHADKAAIPRDNARNNYLTSQGWHVLRFNGHQIREELDTCLATIKASANRLGGVLTPDNLPRRFQERDGYEQFSLW